jgi:hypothetical protein
VSETDQKTSSTAKRSRILNRYVDGRQQFEEIVAQLPANNNTKFGSEEGILEQLNKKDREECLIYYLKELTDDESKMVGKSKDTKRFAIIRRYFKVAKRPKMKF